MTTGFQINGTDVESIYVNKDYLLDNYEYLPTNLKTPQLWGWGNNFIGQLGTNNTTSYSSPVTTVAGGTNWKQVSCGGSHTAAIKTDGTLWTWGWDQFGQLGDNSTTNKSSPIQTVAANTNWKQVACGYQHTAAVKTDGTLWLWGRNAQGQLGNTGGTESSPITTVSGGTNWKQVSCGASHSAAIKTDGTLWTWGLNSSGQLGDNTILSKRSPITTTGTNATNWKQVSCGNYYTAAIKTDGTLWTWGSNSSGQLGTNNKSSYSSPVTFAGTQGQWKQVSCGDFHTTAIKTDGTIWLCGYNNKGQLGTNNTSNYSSPVTTIAGGANWKQVSCGDFHTTAIKTDGTLWAWGSNLYGQLGTNNASSYSSPVTTIAGGANWKQVSCGQLHTLAISESEGW